MMADPYEMLVASQFNLPAIDQAVRQARMGRLQEMMLNRQVALQDKQQQRDEQARTALSGVLATRTPGTLQNPMGTFDTNGPAFQQYAQADPEHALGLLGQLSTQQREAVKAGLSDMYAAVQWADTPEKWAVVQQHYGQYDPKLAAVPFQQREQAIVAVGQMADYLKSTEPKIVPVQPGGSALAVNPHTLETTPLVLPNPGDQPAYAPAGATPSAGPYQEGQTATNPQTGQKIIFQNGQWGPVAGGQTARPSGTFRPVSDARAIVQQLVPQARITDWRRDPNSALGRANPHSWHNTTGAAVDVAPIRGMTFDQYVNTIRSAGHTIIEARDEQAHPMPWTTGPNWHVVIGD